MTPEDDQNWLDALAGRGRADSPAAREGANLRGELLRIATARVIPPMPARDSARETALIAHARRDGLIQEQESAPQGWLWRWHSGLAFAALAGLAIAVGLYMRATVDTEIVVRSTPDGVVRIAAPDPAGLKQQLIEELRAAGVEATGYELLGRLGVDADLPQPLTEEVRRVLDKHGIPAPKDGVLRVEIVPKG